MDQKLLRALRDGNVDLIKEFARQDGNFHKARSPQGNTVLHVAVRSGNKVSLVEILKIQPEILYERNGKGQTPMHIAAAAYDIDIVRIFIDHWKEMKNEPRTSNILRMKDNEGETPLHAAVRNTHLDIVLILTTEDPEPILYPNRDGQSPLFIAIDTGLSDIARWIIQKKPESLDQLGPNELTPLHNAVLRKNYDVMADILKRKKELIKEPDKQKRNALHYAAVSGHVKMTEDLLKAEASLVYEPDIDGQTPLHLATKNGRLRVLKLLVNSYPLAVEVLDKSNRNILHLAAERGYVKIISFVLTFPEMEDLINAPDEEGNTPLHLAAKNFHSDVVDILSSNMKVNIRATNRYRQTALEVVQPSNQDNQKEEPSDADVPKHTQEAKESSAKNVPKAEPSDAEVAKHMQKPKERSTKNVAKAEGAHAEHMRKSDKRERKFSKYLTIKALKAAYAHRALDSEDIVGNRHFDDVEYTDSHDEKGRDMAQTLSVMTTLIATFTFTAAFTIPGGFKNDGPDEGMATLVRKAGFQAFVITDTIAMTSSMTAAVIVFWSFVRSESKHFMDALPLAIFLTWISLISMAVAFVTGLFAVLSNNMILAIFACSIGCALPLTCYVFVPFLSLRSDKSANSLHQDEVNPVAFTIRCIKIFLKKLLNSCFGPLLSQKNSWLLCRSNIINCRLPERYNSFSESRRSNRKSEPSNSNPFDSCLGRRKSNRNDRLPR